MLGSIEITRRATNLNLVKNAGEFVAASGGGHGHFRRSELRAETLADPSMAVARHQVAGIIAGDANQQENSQQKRDNRFRIYATTIAIIP